MKRTAFNSILIKITAIVLIVATAAGMLAGCGPKSVTDGAKSTEEDLRVVGKVGNYEVCYDEYRFVTLACKDMLEGKYGKDIWSTPESVEKYSKMLEDMVAERITANYAVFGLCDAYGFTNAMKDKDAIKYVNAKIENEIYLMAVRAGYQVKVDQKSNGDLKYTYKSGELNKAKDLFYKALADSHLTERVLRITLGAEYAFSRLSEILTKEKNEIVHKAESIEAFMKTDDFICTKHVFIEDDGTKSREELRKTAEMVYGMYLDGASMNSLIGGKYNMDISMPYHGYYFTHGEMDEAYEKAAFGLSVGEVSGVVETDDGFYIIQRCEKNEAYMLQNLETFASQIIYAFVNERVRSYQANISLEKNEFGSSIVLHEMKAD